MKTTTNALVGWIAVAIVLSTTIAAAGPSCYTSQAWLGAATLGQSAAADNSSESKSQQTTDLLRRARQAMAENDLSAADSLISRAEGLGVQYNWLYQGDTPKKARRDLDKKRNSAGAAPAKPSQIFSPLAPNKDKKTPSADPFAGRPVDPPLGTPNAQQVTPLPAVNPSNPIRALSTQGVSSQAPPSQAYPTVPLGENDLRTPGVAGSKTTLPAGPAAPNNAAANDSPLRAARRALALGDVRRAADLVQQEKARRTTYQPFDDTPDKVEAAVRNYQALSALDKNTEAYRRAYARSLMDQADGLLRWGEQDEAERLASRAAGMQITYGPFEQKPQDMLQRIAAMRRLEPGRPSTPSTSGLPNASGPVPPVVAARQKALELVRQARDAIAAGQLDRAEMLARQADQLRLPDSAFAPGEDRPALVLLDLGQLRQRRPSGVVSAGGQYVTPAGGSGEPGHTATRALYDPANDRTRNVPAANQQPAYAAFPADPRLAQNSPQTPTLAPRPPTPSPDVNAGAAARSSGLALFEQGEAALRAHDPARAHDLFRQAANHMNELDPLTAQRLQDHLQLLSAPSRTNPQPAGQASPMADEAVARQQVLVRQVAAELAHRESNARALRETDPKAALATLEEARKKVESAGLDASTRDQMLRSVDRAIAETQQLIERNQPQIELAEKNKQTQQDVERRQHVKIQVQEKLAVLVNDCNKAMDEQEYEKAEVLAKQAADLDPQNPVVMQLLWQSRFVHRFMNNNALIAAKEQAVLDTLGDVDRASVPFAADKNPLVFGDAKAWEKLTKSRAKFLTDRRHRRSEREIEIDKKLQTPVSLQFTSAPLSKVLDYLANLAAVNLHLDPQGLAEEGVASDTAVTINLRNDIMLKSALALILEPLHLSYVIKDEVLKVTSEQMRDGQVYSTTYPVADLVIPIPNFVPTPMGVDAAYQRAMANVNPLGFNGTQLSSSTATPMAVVAKGSNASMNPSLLAQVSTAGPHLGPVATPRNTPAGAGPGGLGGGSQADFDSLIDLIKTTIKPTSWDDTGGAGSISSFETNLSLVISQTQEVHEEIADLLEQLRRLQDLQVTIEVRFITLNDNFFERVGLSFDFDINDNVDGKNLLWFTRTGAGTGTSVSPAVGQGVARNFVDQDSNRTISVGMSAPTLFNADLDIPFTQNSFGLAVPQFGGFDATAGAQLGFAILSDIEAYFFISAAQGDRRSNVLQAPKVTLFNGQQAFVSDTTQSPFVISVIPVVGDFAAAQQPVIVVLSEGTFMTVQAVVSNDKRFVRLTVVPFFSKIGNVNTFQFTGSQTTTTDTSREGLQAAATDPSKLWNKTGDNATTTNSGTTVQLPSFSFVSITTTVSVPDGGTVLLGGIKRLSEGRNEFGVPMLDKVPYLNRLFKNVAIGRETQSLMMMVTPRIIIQEEEEEKLGLAP